MKLKIFYQHLNDFGINLRGLLSIKNLLRFLTHRKVWLRNGGVIDIYRPMLSDMHEDGGTASGQYFHQDLLVAQFIFEDNPRKHIDIGSRVDGFVAHVAAFREIEVVDIRPIKNSAHKNLTFLQVDVSSSSIDLSTDSLSCLHAIEHFGLGRYGDPIDPLGHEKGLENMVSMVKAGGRFYLSAPIGNKDEVHFNAHRIFHPGTIPQLNALSSHMKLLRFDFVDDKGDLHLNKELQCAVGVNYGCGIYTFQKFR